MTALYTGMLVTIQTITLVHQMVQLATFSDDLATEKPSLTDTN